MTIKDKTRITQSLKFLTFGVFFLFAVQSIFQITTFWLFGEYKGGLINARFLISDGLQTWPVITSLLRYFGIYLVLLFALSAISFCASRFLLRKLPIRETISKLFLLNLLIVYFGLMIINVYHFPNSIVRVALVSTFARSGNFTPYYISVTILCFYSIFAIFEVSRELLNGLRKGIGEFGIRAFAFSFFLIVSVIALAQFTDHFHTSGTQNATPEHSKPHIILLGLDSVRFDILEDDQLVGEYLPYLGKFLNQDTTTWYTNSFTPIARTFGAWYAMLSGKNPVTSGVRYNLQQLSPDQKQDTIVQELKKQGYYTIYGSDEKRFSTIDSSYGFDETLGPPAGAADWILSFLEDSPIHNIIRGSTFSEYLLPHTYGNRASYTTYLPEQFVGQISRRLDDLDNAQPLFLALHFCLSHWPYTWASSNSHDSHLTLSSYLESLKVLDEQFRQVQSALQANNILQNAIFIVFTDHGEGFSLKPDAPINSDMDNVFSAFSKSGNHSPGHGTDLFSISQNQILISVQDNTSRKILAPGKFDRLTSLVDIAPTIAQVIGSPKNHYDGVSLAVHEREGIGKRVVFMETGFDLAVLHRAELNIEELVRQGSSTYEISDDGMLQVKAEFHNKILQEKQKGVTDGQYIIASGRLSEDRRDSGKQAVVIDLTHPEHVHPMSDYLKIPAVSHLKNEYEKYYSERLR